MMQIVNVADLIDPNNATGKTYRQVNNEKTHAIKLGTLVELEDGERLFVRLHTRDCDGTPFYSLGTKDGAPYTFHRGYGEEDLKVVAIDAV